MSSHLAQATALLAAHAYVLVRFMAIFEADQAIPSAWVFVGLLPLVGMGLAYDELGESESTWREQASFWLLAIMAALWGGWQIIIRN